MRSGLLFCTAVPVLALAIASLVRLPEMLIYNASASAPIGFYWLDDRAIERGDYALVRVPERVRQLVEDRGYLPPDVPLIKRVTAIAGDDICRHGTEILVNGTTMAAAQEADSSGRRLPDWQGCSVLTERTVFLLQDHPQSFDGRYFGPVETATIIGRATLLWTF